MPYSCHEGKLVSPNPNQIVETNNLDLVSWKIPFITAASALNLLSQLHAVANKNIHCFHLYYKERFICVEHYSYCSKCIGCLKLQFAFEENSFGSLPLCYKMTAIGFERLCRNGACCWKPKPYNHLVCMILAKPVMPVKPSRNLLLQFHAEYTSITDELESVCQLIASPTTSLTG